MLLVLLFVMLNIYASDSTDTVIDMTPVTDSSTSTPIHDICDDMIHYYFKGNGEQIRDQIKPYLQRKLASSWKRQKIIRIEGISLKRSSTIVDPDIERYINKKVSQAMEEALQEEHQIRMRYQAESSEKVTKNQVAVITAITGVVTAAITAGVTIAIAFGT